jgi:hypothetical protein
MQLVCTEPSCGHQSRQLLFRKRAMCSTTAVKCNNLVKQEVEANAVYNQLLYYRSLFDRKAAQLKDTTIMIPPEHNELFRRLYETADRFISQSAYNCVHLKQVLGYYDKQSVDETQDESGAVKKE